MGNFLGVGNVKSTGFDEERLQKNKDLIYFLKKKSMRNVSEVVETIRDYYPTNSTFTFEEFEDAFSFMLDDHVEQFFLAMENNQNIGG